MDRAEIFLGTQGWSYRDWVGSFYPPGTPSRAYLQYYASQFRAVELDSTFYGTPRPAQVRAWYEATPAEFCFTAKVPKLITHDQRLVSVTDELAEFVEVMTLLEEKLGPLLIQLPPD